MSNVVPLFVNPRCANCRWWTPFDAMGPFGFCEAGDETVHEGWSCENFARGKTAQPVETIRQSYSDKV